MTHDAQPLPGLEPPAIPAGEVEAAARRTIVALEAQDLIAERDAVLTQALVTLARQYDRAAAGAAKSYAVANLHAQLLATIEQLPRLEEGDDDDPWTKLERTIHEQQCDAAARDLP